MHRLFQHTATRRWLLKIKWLSALILKFQHTATRRWLRTELCQVLHPALVSTHSHPKVAANLLALNHCYLIVSTHSHPKVAANSNRRPVRLSRVSTHSHPKVAAKSVKIAYNKGVVSTHSHPKVAAAAIACVFVRFTCFNTQPPEGGCW